MTRALEQGVRERFDEARKNAPCLIFIDELDAIAPKRESSQSQMEKRIVAQLLVSMDELERDDQKPVIVIAATNRPDSIDPALRRGGRFDTEINIGVPNERVRERILKTQTRQSPLSKDVDFRRLAKMTAGFVGADLHDLVGKAGASSLRRFREALQKQAANLDLVGISRSFNVNGMSESDDQSSKQTSEVVNAQRNLIAVARRNDLPSKCFRAASRSRS